MRSTGLLFASLALAFAPVAYSAPTRTLDGQQITNGGAVLTLPTTTDTLTGRTTTDTLTNKTLSGSSNTLTDVPATALSGAVPIVNGGTGATSRQGAANAILPAQTGAAGFVLTSDGTNASFLAVPSSAPNITGTKASPTAVTAAGGLTLSTPNYNNIAFVVGSGGPVSVSAASQITGCTLAGQRLTVIGESNSNSVTFPDGNGLSLNGSWVGGLNSALSLICDSSIWVEVARR